MDATVAAKIWDRTQMAARVAQDIPEGWYVNLGIGIPTLVPNYLVDRPGVVVHAENGVLGVGTFPSAEEVDPDVINAAKMANAHAFIMERPDGYDSEVEEGGNNFSSGEKQRLAIARAILHNPRILILDEATSALDTESERAVQEALEALMQDRTTLVIAHRLSTIQRATRICVLNHGEIVEVGAHEALLAAKGEYDRLYQLQFRA